MSIGGLFNIGQSALNAQQSTIATTGNNIANVNTPGYSRQYVQLEDAFALTGKPGSQGMGVDAVQVLRRFDEFIEVSYLDKSTHSSRWEQQSTTMTSVESIFNEANRTGISDSMTEFFKAWQDLALRPDDPATRQNLISNSDNLALLMRQSMEDLDQISDQMDLSIQVDVDRANELVESIADLNKQISQNTIAGMSNPNDLLDKRDVAIRELATIIDIDVQYEDGFNTTVRLSNGLPLVQGHETFSLEIQGPQSESNKLPDSTYTGSITFDGSDAREYTVEMLSGGNAGAIGDPDNPTFRVSLDGGKTWLRNDDGTEAVYEVTDDDGDGQVDPITVHNIKISFDETENFTAGDKFNITPKSGLYWIEPTRGPYNITPQTYFDGTENQDRLSGGSLTAFFTVRDEVIGRYEDELDAVANALIWEVNRLHSQGGSIEHMTYYTGTQQVSNVDIALGTPQSGLHFADKLTEGSVNFHFYDKETGSYFTGGPVDFDPTVDGIQNFDPTTHSLNDVADAINNAYGGVLSANILDNKLSLEVNDPDLEFAVGTDSSGLMAALGLNSYFQGDSASNIAVDTDVHSDLNRINAGYVDGSNEVNPGDNANASSLAAGIGDLISEKVQISTVWRTTGDQSISEYYSTFVSKVGADTRTAHTNAEYNTALADDLDAQQQAVSGVNLDEEMANLIKFQHAYTAAAKLITTADQMLQTLLGLKQ